MFYIALPTSAQKTFSPGLFTLCADDILLLF